MATKSTMDQGEKFGVMNKWQKRLTDDCVEGSPQLCAVRFWSAECTKTYGKVQK